MGLCRQFLAVHCCQPELRICACTGCKSGVPPPASRSTHKGAQRWLSHTSRSRQTVPSHTRAREWCERGSIRFTCAIDRLSWKSCRANQGSNQFGHPRVTPPTVCHHVDWLFSDRRYAEEPRFPHLAMIGVVESRIERNGAVAAERRYHLSSAKLDGKTFAAAVRAHSGVENRLHWVPRTVGTSPRSMRLSMSACTVVASTVAPSTRPSGCLSPFASTPIAATRSISSSM